MTQTSYYQIVRNFGEGGDLTPNSDFPLGSEDGTISTLPYWYQVLYQDDTQAIGFGSDYREFQYGVTCSSQGNAQVQTRVQKVFRVGY